MRDVGRTQVRKTIMVAVVSAALLLAAPAANAVAMSGPAGATADANTTARLGVDLPQPSPGGGDEEGQQADGPLAPVFGMLRGVPITGGLFGGPQGG